VAGCSGIGGRIKSEWVAGYFRNQWPDDPGIRTLGPDEAEVMTRALLEKAVQDTVMSFQRLNEQLYEKKTGKVAKRNAFQRLDGGSDLWEAVIGVTYAKLCGDASLKKLQVYFQQRHLLAHQQGIVDQDYIERSGDTTYQIGQRLIIRDAVVSEFVDLVEMLGKAVITQCE